MSRKSTGVDTSLCCNYNCVIWLGVTCLRWTWEQAKSEANLRAHSLSFEAAVFLFDDPMSATQEDPYPYEQRWRTIGMVGTQVVMVVHTWTETYSETGEETGRIISARKATRHEREAYEEGYY